MSEILAPFDRAAPIRPSLFELPFTRRVSPDADAADRHHLAWMRRHRMAESDAAIGGLEAAANGLVAAVLVPGLRGDDLNLAADWIGWIVQFDDQFDGPIGDHPDNIARVMENMIDILRGEPGKPPHVFHPGEAALADLMKRTRSRMSSTWSDRFFEHQARFMTSVCTEMTQRLAMRAWNLEEYMGLRNYTAWVPPLIDLNETSIGYELPEVLSNSWEAATMRHELNFSACCYNDVYTLPKDITRGDPHNAVLVLQHLNHWTQDQAMEHLRTCLDASLSRYLDAQAQLPKLFDSLRLPDIDRRGCLSWSQAMDDLWFGCHNFHLYHPRYSSEAMSKPAKDVDVLDYWNMLPDNPKTPALSRNPQC